MVKTLSILEESDQVIVQFNTTNGFRNMDTKQYMTMVNGHLIRSSKEIDRVKVREIFEKGRDLMNGVGFQ